jgi:hypothetical protein
VLPNYTPPKWFENDVFEVTRAGYWHEYEVKVSRSDFFADFAKCKWLWDECGSLFGKEKATKHTLLSSHAEFGPSRFTFVVAEGIVELDEVPEWAGLMIVKPARYGVNIRQVKKAPRLHGLKHDMQHTKMTCYYRYHNAVTKYEDVYQEQGSGI